MPALLSQQTSPCLNIYLNPSSLRPSSFQPAQDQWTDALAVANLVFTAVFVGEMLLKWSAIGFKAYFLVRGSA